MIRGELARRAASLAAERVPFALATVVRARHPTSVRPGDCALVLSDGTIEGFVGGACASSSVRLHGLRVLETGEPLLLRLVPDDEGAAASLGPGEDAVVVERNPCLSGGALEIFLEPQLPLPRMLVVGDSPIAQALASLAGEAGYDAVRTPAAETDPRPTDAALVVASHGSDEERVLSQALGEGIPYVALVASRTRGAAVRAALDVPDELRAQLHTPAGLDLGASTPPEVAIAILAELVAQRHTRRAEPAITPPLEALDPVCGMRVAISGATPRIGDVFFCSEYCREKYARRDVTTA
jgi:xanthine dehydrogenase accessory factor